MLEHIISKLVLDMVCPVCGGVSYYSQTRSAYRELVICKNCDGVGKLYRNTNVALVVTDKSSVDSGVVSSMALINAHVLEPTDDVDIDFHRIYFYNVPVASVLPLNNKHRPKEIHIYFGEN